MSGVNIQIVHYFDHGYLEKEKSMIHSFSYFWGKIFDRHGHKTFSLIQNNILHQSKFYKNHFENSNFRGHVTYSFKIMLFISTGIFDYKLRPQILSVVPTANAPLT